MASPLPTTLCPLSKTHLDNLQHLHPGDLAVPVQIIHVESPVQFLLKAASGGDGQGTDELSEVDGAITVLVKGAEGVLRKLGCISIGEELQRTHKSLVRSGRKYRRREALGLALRMGRGSYHAHYSVVWLQSIVGDCVSLICQQNALGQ